MKNKFLRSVTTLSIAAAICMACGVVTASAETGDEGETTELNTLSLDSISVDYETQEIKVNLDEEDANKQILFGVSSVAKKTSVLKTATWEVYDAYSVVKGEDGAADTTKVKPVVIDISSLNTQKDNYVQIKGDQSSDPITLHIPATEKKIKAKFNPGSGKIENNKGADGSDKLDLEYRTLYGEWSDFGTLSAQNVDLSMYQQRGATLYIRQKSSGISTVEDEDETITITTMSPSNGDGDGKGSNLNSKPGVKDADGNDLKAVYEMGSLPGKEIKVSVGKKANGPKIAINYQKNTVTIPKGAMWRVNGAKANPVEEGDDQTYTWTMGTFKAAGTTKYDLKEDEVALLFNGGNVEAYTDNSANPKKADSKITHIDLTNKRASLTLPDTNNKDDVNGNKVGDVEAKVSESKGKFTLEVKNNSTDKAVKYQVIVNDSDTEAGTTGAKTIGAGKSYKVKNVADGKCVWISKVGDAKSQTWSTEYVFLGKVVAKAAGEESEDQKALQAFADFAEGKKISSVPCASNGAVINMLDLDEGVTWGEPATYGYDSKEIKDVTIAVTSVTGSGASNVTVSDGKITVPTRPANTSTTYEITATVTFSKTGCKAVTKDIPVTITRS